MSRALSLTSPILAFLGLSALLATGCGLGRDYTGMSGEEIFKVSCAQCHGLRGQGGSAPTYRAKRQYWDEEKLLEYIHNPAAYKKKAPHLTGRHMNPVDGTMPEDARRRLVEHVLELMDSYE